MFGIFGFGHARDDKEAEAAAARLEQVTHFIDSFRNDDRLMALFSEGLYAVLAKFREISLQTLPEHCHNDYIMFLNPQILRKESKNMSKQASKNIKKKDDRYVMMAYIQEAVALYLLSNAWDIIRQWPNDSSKWATYPGSVRLDIENTIKGILSKTDKEIPV